MDKLVVVLSTAVIILGIVSGFLFYQLNTVQNQINTLEARLSNYPPLVKIADVEVYGFSPFVGLSIQSAADVTIENIGVNDVEGLTLTIVHSSGYSRAENLDILHSGEIREINSYVEWIVGTIGTITFTLKLDNVTLDEYILENYDLNP